MIVIVVFGWFMGGKLPGLLTRLSRGAAIHVYMPIVRMHRRIIGTPTWQVVDCLTFLVQPTTDEEIARAQSSGVLVLFACQCGQPDCYFPKPTWLPRDGVEKSLAELARRRRKAA
jgi:hypothetical protein